MNMHPRLKIILLLVIFLGGVTLLNAAHVSKVSAQDKEAYYSRYDVDIRINLDGSISVNETMTITYVRGTFTYAYREIPFYGFDDIINIKLYEVVQGSLIEYSMGSNKPECFSVVKTIDSVKIKWWYEEINVNYNSVKRTFILSYVATSALDVDISKGINYLHWYALPNEHLFIEKSTVRIWLPSIINSDDLTIKPAPDNIVTHNKAIEIEYFIKNIYEYESLEIYIEFPKVINPPFSIRKTLNRYVVLIIVLVVIVPLPLLYLYRYRIRKRLGVNPALYRASTEPPKDLDQTQIHVLKHLHGSRILPLVTLFQLAEKKLIKFVQVNDKELYVRAENSSEVPKLKPWEAELFEIISGEVEIKLKDLYRKLIDRAYVSEVRERALETLIKKGYIPDHPSNMGLKQTGITLLTFISTSILLIALAYSLLIAALLMIGIVALTITILYAVAIKFISVHRTRQGEIELLKARGYVNYLNARLSSIIDSSDEDRIIDTLNAVINNNFSWIIAINGIKAFTKLKKLSKAITKRWKGSNMIIYWYPFWLYYAPSRAKGIGSLDDLAKTLSNISTIFMRSGGGFVGGVGGVGGGAGGGGAAGVG